MTKLMLALVLAAGLGCARAHDTFAPDAWADSPVVAPPTTSPGGGDSAPPAAASGRVLAPIPSLAPLVKELRPSVLNIATTMNPHPRARRRGQPQTPDQEDQMQEFLHRFFGDGMGNGGGMEGQQQARHALGSGFYIGGGFALTNNHVVDGADDIKVKTDDGVEIDAEVVGRDPKTDVAVIRLKGDAAKSIPAVKLGDSDALEVGDYVIAIGEPFGLQATVTSGIVSAKERVIGAGPYDDFIQTDASINPGNSGGPLFNLRGEVVGMNTAIIQNSGIGFAVPVNLVKELLPQLEKNGKVVRGWLGVGIQELTPDLSKAAGLGAGTKGALVTQVFPGSPAEKAGLKSGDVVTSFNGKSIRNQNELSRIVAGVAPGKSIDVKYLRDGKELAASAKIAERNDEEVAGNQPGAPARGVDALGLTVSQVTPELRRQFGLGDEQGVVITDEQPDGPAAANGLEPGDLLLEVNRQPINSVGDYRRVAGALGPGTTALVRVRRGGGAIYVAVKIPPR